MLYIELYIQTLEVEQIYQMNKLKINYKYLNEDFSKTNSEFPNPPRNSFINYAANPGIKFCLASIDPNGNPTTGITRTATSKTSFDADDDEYRCMMLTE